MALKTQCYMLWDERMMLHKPIRLELQDMENPNSPNFVYERPSRVRAIYEALKQLEVDLAMIQDDKDDDEDEENGKQLIERGLHLADLDSGFASSWGLDLSYNGDKDRRFIELKCKPADKETVCLAHSEQHYERIKRTSVLGDVVLKSLDLNDDLYFCKDTFLAASLAVGGCVQAVNAVCDAEYHQPNRAIAVVRPPGHHATKEKAMGFCYFNNIAVAAKHAIATGRASRVFILDIDIHHGNGIQDLTYDDPCIFYLSLHRSCRDSKEFFYPGTGWPEEVGAKLGRGTNLNIAFDTAGAGNTEYAAAFQRVVLPVISLFNPDLVIVACGFDAAQGDLLGDFGLSSEMFYVMTRSVIERAGRYTPLVVALEGGYNLKVMKACMEAVALALLDEPNFHKSKTTQKPSQAPHQDLDLAQSENMKPLDTDLSTGSCKSLRKFWHRDLVIKNKATRHGLHCITKSVRALARTQNKVLDYCVARPFDLTSTQACRIRRLRLLDCDRYPVKKRLILKAEFLALNSR